MDRACYQRTAAILAETCRQKEVMFLEETEEILDVIEPTQFKALEEPF